MSTANRASGSLATFTSRTILPVSSTMQTLVSLTDMSNPAKWSMLRFSPKADIDSRKGSRLRLYASERMS